jgi:polyhydroxybutyrate depolymerase
MRTMLAALVAVLLLAGCATTTRPDPYPPGSTSHTLEVDGTDRTYRVYVPSTLGEGPAALVVMLHGGFGSAEQAELVYGWDRQAERDGTVIAYPDGVGRSWNAGGCCGAAAKHDVDDVGFVEAMVAEIARGIDIDPRRTYATGMSNGGILAYRLACVSDLFAAIAPVSATMLVDCHPPGPVSVLHIQGALDESVPPDGSPGAGTQQIDGPPIDEVIAFWRGVDGCGPPVSTTVTEVTTTRADCGGDAVEYIEIADAGHQWPGAISSETRDELGGDPPSQRLDATAEIAAFFAAHPRR